MQALQLFNSAKAKLARELEAIGQYEILEVKEVEIKGREVKNEDIIEEQLEEDFNESEDVITEDDLAEAASVVVHTSLEMSIVFRVGPKGEHHSDDHEYNDRDRDSNDEESS
jgi:hypothetical protein